ncbi:MAG: sodium:solute symporter [Ignavibacteriaceae bacterium]|jgi:Na+/proline symporter|nr:sodium:solute symporter [Chlorobium sp.]MCW9096813.1 sodium:solute symporter [Ignavibacteriaceae bacterium]
MTTLDWIVMCGFIGFIVLYGTWKSRNTRDVDTYMRAGKTSQWWLVALSIMATQASAITFLSTPGQAYVDGMRFIQFYLGLPIAMIILCITAIPVYNKLNVYTAYEYLEKRFDLKNRMLGSALFLTQRGLAAGFTIYAPALILSIILGWEMNVTIIIVGAMVILYTTVGGTVAVNKTHFLQMIIITVGMFSAFFVLMTLMPKDVSITDAAYVAGKMGKLNAIDFSFDLSNRYTFWSGIIGGTFLMLSYFGTDQSQVQRYLAGSSVTQSRLGLLTNGLVKLPMQFIILFIGAMVFVFYQFVTPPLFFNPVEEAKVKSGQYSTEYESVEKDFQQLHTNKQSEIKKLISSIDNGNENQIEKHTENVVESQKKANELRLQAAEIIKKSDPSADTNDTNYIFISFVINFLPVGFIGLLIAAILSASMSSTSAELNALASTTVIDFYQRLYKKNASDSHYLKVSKTATVFWGIYAILFALLAKELGSLVEAVNILGSLVYGTILGIFLTAFYLKRVSGTPTFLAAIIAELLVLYCYFFTDIPFLWYNVIGCFVVVGGAFIVNSIILKTVNRE